MPPHRHAELVLLPGLDGTGLLLRRFRESIDPSIPTTLVCYPLDRPLDYVGLEAIARSRLPKQEPFVLLAESFSGPIAISIAATRPPGLRGLVLACSFACNPRPAMAPLGPLIRLLPVRQAPVAMLAWPTLGRFGNPALQSALVDALRRVSPAVIRSRLRAVAEVDVSPLLPQIDVPVLYLRASADRLVPSSASDALAALPRIRFAQIEGPHFLLQANPSAAAAHIQAFLREIEAPH